MFAAISRAYPAGANRPAAEARRKIGFRAGVVGDPVSGRQLQRRAAQSMAADHLAGVGLWVSWRRERRRHYDPAHRVRRRPPSSGPGQKGLT